MSVRIDSCHTSLPTKLAELVAGFKIAREATRNGWNRGPMRGSGRKTNTPDFTDACRLVLAVDGDRSVFSKDGDIYQS
jgi:hypothetical protein